MCKDRQHTPRAARQLRAIKSCFIIPSLSNVWVLGGPGSGIIRVAVALRSDTAPDLLKTVVPEPNHSDGLPSRLRYAARIVVPTGLWIYPSPANSFTAPCLNSTMNHGWMTCSGCVISSFSYSKDVFCVCEITFRDSREEQECRVIHPTSAL